MSLNKFKAPKGKLLHTTADWSIRRGKKSEYNQAGYEIGIGRPWEFQKVKNLGTVPPKPTYKKEKMFDVSNDGLPFKKKKIPREWDLRKPWMLDEKKTKQYHYHG